MKKLRLRLSRLSFKADMGCVGVCSISSEDKKHPNKLPFTGVLLKVDQASDKPPHGSEGHLIHVSRKAAERNLSSLIGTGVNYDTQDLNEHVPRHKVGVITGAKIVNDDVKVWGYVWSKDFPEAKRQLQGRRDLGMSMELSDVLVSDDRAKVWNLEDFKFAGATILKKNAAAYTSTDLAASSSRVVKKTTRDDASQAAVKGEGEPMKAKTKKKQVAAAGDTSNGGLTVEALTAAITAANKPMLDAITNLSGQFDQMSAMTIRASAQALDDDEDEETQRQVQAAKEEEEEEDEDMSAANGEDEEEDEEEDDEDEEDSDELSAELEDLEDKAPVSEPGEINKNAKGKGNKTGTTDVGAEASGKKPFPNLVKGKGMKASMQAAAEVLDRQSRMIRRLNAQAADSARRERKLTRKIERLEAQVERFAEHEDRRSHIPTDLTNLFAKANVDLRELQASGTKLSVAQVDAVISQSGMDMDVTQRMAWKNRLLEQGLMESGEVTRQYQA